MHAELKKIPGVDKLLNLAEIKELEDFYGKELVTFSIRLILKKLRERVLNGKKADELEKILENIKFQISSIAEKSLKPMINATGIVLHTNLGRTPLGKEILKELEPVIAGYSNLEFDLKTGKRGQRNAHISSLIKFITKAEDAVVVNNNAAGVMLCLKTFAAEKEVIISRGELIEIGGSFRIPEIMAASGAKMVEVGATNRTRISDYEKAITHETRMIFKAHKSNYFIGGFTEDVEMGELSQLAEKHGLIFVYDLGSGLLRKPEGLPLEKEPDVRSSLKAGADIVTFSGDKLLGGPQAGIIAGRKKYVSQLAKAPMMRALRVGKMTIAALSFVISRYLKDESLKQDIPIFRMLNRDEKELKRLAEKLTLEINKFKIKTKIIKSKARCGGGTLPELIIDSYAVQIIPDKKEKKFAERVFAKLLQREIPILGILREGNLLFDVLSIFEEDIPVIAESLVIPSSRWEKNKYSSLPIF